MLLLATYEFCRSLIRSEAEALRTKGLARTIPSVTNHSGRLRTGELQIGYQMGSVTSRAYLARAGQQTF